MRSMTWIGSFAGICGILQRVESAAMPVVTCIEDLRELAKKRVARAVFEYVDRGSYAQCTLRVNRADLESLALRQRVGIDVDRRSTRATMVGAEVTMPVALAPVGLTGLNWADGEILAARAAQRFGVPFTLSTMSICSIEDVAGAVEKPFWFQLYVMRDRGFAASLIERAGGEVLGARADARPPGPGPAPPRPEERPHRSPRLTLGTAFDVLKTGLGAQRAAQQAQVVRQPRGPHSGRNSLTTLSQWIAGSSIHAVLEGRGVGEEALGRQARPQGHPRRRGCEDRRASAPTRSWSRTTAAASSTARFPRSARCPKSSRR